MNTLALMPASECRALYEDRLKLARQLMQSDLPTREIAKRCGWKESAAHKAISKLLKTPARKPKRISKVSSVDMQGWNVGDVWFEAFRGDDGRYVVTRRDMPGAERYSETFFGVFRVADEWVKETSNGELHDGQHHEPRRDVGFASHRPVPVASDRYEKGGPGRQSTDGNR